jgi:hypothetical protein
MLFSGAKNFASIKNPRSTESRIPATKPKMIEQGLFSFETRFLKDCQRIVLNLKSWTTTALTFSDYKRTLRPFYLKVGNKLSDEFLNL